MKCVVFVVAVCVFMALRIPVARAVEPDSQAVAGVQSWVQQAFAPSSAGAALPFSFLIDGRPSREALGGWTFARVADTDDFGPYETLSWTDPETGLAAECTVRTFPDASAADWVLRFRNTGTADSPIIEDVLPLDACDLPGGMPADGAYTLRWSNGDRYYTHDPEAPPWACGETKRSFMPTDDDLPVGVSRRFESQGSFRYLPFFNLQSPDGGWVIAVGWTGNWAAEFDRTGKGSTAVRAGLGIKTRFSLRPGESVRTPSIVIVRWTGRDMIAGHNLFRRLMLDHYVPRRDGKPAQPPIAGGGLTPIVVKAIAEGRVWEPWWDDYTERDELEAIPKYKQIGAEVLWVDAWWFPQPWGENCGNWRPRPDAFPGGIRPISDSAHEHGMDFLLWMIPQQVNAGTDWANEHPEFIYGGGEGRGGLWRMGDPEARRWITDWLCDRIEEWGIDIYREDGSGMPPEEGSENRQGVEQMKYVEGLYQFYSDLLARNPGLRIDNCCGGGNRVDVETMKRCFYLHRSDLNDWPSWANVANRPFMPTGDQNLIAGLSLYAPLHSSGTWQADPYTFRSNMHGGGSVVVDFDDPASVERARTAIAELRALRPLFLGDIYPLLPLTDLEENWYAYQLDRPDLGEGCAFVFRRPLSGYRECELSLRGIDPDGAYLVSETGNTYTYGEWRPCAGSALQSRIVRIDDKPGSALIRYKRAGAE